MLRKATVCLALLGTAAAACGCLFGGHEVPPKVDVEGKKVAVLPFRDRDSYFLDSKVGAEVAGLVVQLMLKEAFDVKLFDPAPAFDLIRDKDPEAIEWGKVAQKLDVDYLIVGHILKFRSRDPVRDVNCYKGEVAIQVTVWRRDASIAFAELVNASYPSSRFEVPVMSFFDTTEDEVLGRLKVEVARKIGRFFFPYAKDED